MKRLACFFLIFNLLLSLQSAVFADSPAEMTAETASTEPAATDPVATEPAAEEPEVQPDTYHKPFISGFPDGGFYPALPISRAEMAVLLYALGSYEPGPACFSDIPDDSWYTVQVNALAAAGILEPYPDGGFHPGEYTTRAQLAYWLATISGETYTTAPTFSDVPEDYWAYDAIALAQEKGWVAGYPDGTFGPERSISRAETVVLINRFTGRTPDLYTIDSSDSVRFFPDVEIGCWYYYAVVEAATAHTAHYEPNDPMEHWIDPQPGYTPQFSDGFYLFYGNIFAVENGAYVRTAGTHTLNNITYTCSGKSGICTAQTEVLPLVNGDLVLLSGGRPIASPGGYLDGLYLKAGHLYAAKDGYILHTACTGTCNGVSYTCTGASGRCIVEDWTKLNLNGIDLSVFSQTLTPEATATGNSNATTADVLRAAVRVYEAYFRVEYPIHSNDMQDYISKALEYGILDQVKASYDQPANRGDTAIYLWRALRGRTLDAINDIPKLPDVDASNPCYRCVLSLYRAGVMTGSGEEHNACISEPLTVSELAELLTRLERVSKRVSFSLPTKIFRTVRYGTSGSGTYPLNAYQIGDGSNVMVLSFALHGWEDNWNRDGEALVELADKLSAYLDANYDLVKNGNWTVYILRCMNPDGLYLGTTCNGPGRCTTTYYNADGELMTDKGIDMNRCFPYCFRSYTGSRNFNGSEPLACAEARAAADFVTKVKGSGFNILIDTHGWYGQIITSNGKGTIYDAFHNQFTSNSYASLYGASGYFSSWTAYELNYDSCLLELPAVYSYEAFLNAGCIGKYESAIADLLQHYNGPNATKSVSEKADIELNGN